MKTKKCIPLLLVAAAGGLMLNTSPVHASPTVSTAAHSPPHAFDRPGDQMWWADAGKAALSGAVTGAVAGAAACMLGTPAATDGALVGAGAGAVGGFLSYAATSAVDALSSSSSSGSGAGAGGSGGSGSSSSSSDSGSDGGNGGDQSAANSSGSAWNHFGLSENRGETRSDPATQAGDVGGSKVGAKRLDH